MSQALQRVIVRMMVDPPFAAQVQAGLELPELTEAERRHLGAVDPRAFHTDPYRRSRLFQACMQELPVGVALLSRGGQDLPAADAFFSSEAFHACVQGRGVVVLAMGAWLEERVGPVAGLELAVAKARRRRHPRGEGLALGPRLWPLAIPPTALERWQGVRGALGADPVATLVKTRVQLPELASEPAHTGPTEEAQHLLVRVDDAGNAGLEGSSEGIDGLLRAAQAPRSRASLLGELEAQGAPSEVASELLDELLEERILVQARGPGMAGLSPSSPASRSTRS